MTDDLARELREIKAMLAQLLAAAGKTPQLTPPPVFSSTLEEARYIKATGGDIVLFLKEKARQQDQAQRAAKRKGRRL
jgi:hypothetical protein